STFYDNSAANGAAIYIDVPARRTTLNNVTIAGNDAAPNAALVYMDHVPVPTEDRDGLLNSVVVGNADLDCFFSANASNHAFLSYLVSNGCGAAGGGLDEERPGYNSDSASFDVLLDPTGVACPAATGPAACAPSTDYETGFAGFLPNSLATGPAAYNAGSPLSAVADPCFSQDQRGADRADRCDAGAFEFQLSQGLRDEFELVQGRTEEIDVLENDQGDNPIDCTGAFTVAVTLPVVNAAPGTPGVSDCVQIPIAPRDGDVGINIDVDGYPTLSYRSEPAFHGLDSLRYSVSKDAVQGATFADGDLSAQVNLVVEPASGFTASENIDDLGGTFVWWQLLLAACAGALRRFRILVTGALFAFAGTAQGADITVNTTLDSLNYGDDLCSIREAIGNSVDSIPSFSPDCASGATGRDTILLPAGTISLSSPLQIDNTAVEFEGEGVGVTILESGGAFRVITATSSIRMRFLTVQNGNTTGSGGAISTTANLALTSVELIGNQADGDGGAIFLNFNSDEQRDVSFSSVLFRGNQAAVNGGAVAMVGQFQQHDIEIEGATFDANTAGQEGGAMDVNLAEGGSLNIANTTFTQNVASSGGSSLDLKDTEAPVRIMNTTFLNENAGGAVGAIDMGDTTAQIQMNHSVYANAGNCSSGASRFTTSSQDNVFSAPRDATCQYAGELLPPDPGARNQTADGTEISTVLGDTLVAGDGLKDDYYPDHFAIDPSASASPAYPFIVDAGKEGDLRPGFAGADRCRLVDLRDASREAGARCDIGAFELQIATAVPDEDDNNGRDSRTVLVDVLDNDLAGEGGTILSGTISFTSLPATGSVSVVSRSDEDVLCGTFNGGGAADDCVVLYEAPAGLTCADFEDDPFEESFSYEFDYTSTVGPAGTSTSGADNPGDDIVTVSVDNVAPQMRGQTRYTEAGIPVVFPLIVDDPDSAVAPSNFTI
ncbi:MAG: choice-of-anchor Q domain-containing protein, partial [Alcanivoracaceae bacterium]